MPILGIWASSFRSAAGPVGAYDALATITVPSGGVASITFSGIPTGYKHLQLRTIDQNNRTTYTTSDNTLRINGDTGNNYANHSMASNQAGGSTVDAGSGSSIAGIYTYTTTSSVAGNTFGSTIIDFLDYANVNKNKTVRILSGADTNGATAGYTGCIKFASGLWMSTSAITSITVSPQFGSLLTQNSSFALYGVK
jgi:hypothetical protein